MSTPTHTPPVTEAELRTLTFVTTLVKSLYPKDLFLGKVTLTRQPNNQYRAAIVCTSTDEYDTSGLSYFIRPEVGATRIEALGKVLEKVEAKGEMMLKSIDDGVANREWAVEDEDDDMELDDDNDAARWNTKAAGKLPSVTRRTRGSAKASGSNNEDEQGSEADVQDTVAKTMRPSAQRKLKGKPLSILEKYGSLGMTSGKGGLGRGKK